MVIKYDSSNPDSLLDECLKAKEEQEQRREALIRHCTMSSATLTGIAVVLGNIQTSPPLLRYLTVCGVVCLFLSVLSGLYYCWRRTEIALAQISGILRRYAEGTLPARASESSRLRCAWTGIACPILLCCGILFFVASEVLALCYLS